MKNQYFVFLGALSVALLGAFACQNSNSSSQSQAVSRRNKSTIFNFATTSGEKKTAP